jgi:hypothetical protein
MRRNHAATIEIPTLVFVFWSKIAPLRLLSVKVHYHDAKFTCLFEECAAAYNHKTRKWSEFLAEQIRD